MSTKNSMHERLQTLEDERPVVHKELECIRRELSEKSAELANERVKLESLIRSEQSLRLRHDAALESLEKLAADSESLRRRADAADEERRLRLESERAKESQLENMQYENEILQNALSGLKLEMKKAKENELLLVKYPDLYGPVPQVVDEELNVQEDMVNQISANKHRMQLLEGLNRKLEVSLRKLREVHSVNNDHNNSIFNGSIYQENTNSDGYFGSRNGTVNIV